MIRKILRVDSDTVSLTLPKTYIGKMLEIIAFTYDEETNKEILEPNTATFNALSLNTVGFKFNREEANER